MAKERQVKERVTPVILVVDDEPMLLELVEMILKPEGFDVRTFSDPLRAVADYAAMQPPPGVVITDYAMAGLNGLEVIRECRKLNPRQKTILVSGTVDEGAYVHADIRPDIFIAKPYNTDEFVATVRALIDHG